MRRSLRGSPRPANCRRDRRAGAADICLIDENLQGGALVAVVAIYKRVPSTRLIVLTDSEEPKGLLAAVRAGACGYFRTDVDPAGCWRRSVA